MVWEYCWIISSRWNLNKVWKLLVQQGNLLICNRIKGYQHKITVIVTVANKLTIIICQYTQLYQMK